MQKVLIVDDDDPTREVIKNNLANRYEVFDTGDPEKAMALALEHRPDAILLDLAMPRLSGFELCRALSSLSFTQQIPIFIISGQDMKNDAFCKSLGARGYFGKPIDFEKLRSRLAELVHPRTEQRADIRVQLRVTLRLEGRSRNGAYFKARVATENISKGGFLCTGPSSLEDATTIAVSLCGEREIDLGFARLVRVVKSELTEPRYGFQFIGTSGAKILE